MIKVLIGDDEGRIRSSLREIVCTADDIEVVADCANGPRLIEQARRLRPDVVLLDVRLRAADGLDTLHGLRALPEPPKVAMLSTFDADSYVHQALRLGATGFLLKDTEPAQLVTAVRDLAVGGVVLDPGVAAKVVQTVVGEWQVAVPARRLLDSLSARERDVARLIGSAMSNAEIGVQLHLSEATVKGYVSAVLSKIGAANRVQAALVAYRGGLVA